MTSIDETKGGATRNTSRVALIISVMCALLLMGLTAVTVVDVIGRYVFNAPLSGGSELTEFLLLGVIFIGLPAITLDKAHISIDLFTAHLPTRTGAILLFVVQAISAGFFALLGWQLLEHAERLALYQDMTMFLRIPFAPFCTAAAYLMMLCALIVIIQMVRPIVQHVKKGSL